MVLTDQPSAVRTLFLRREAPLDQLAGEADVTARACHAIAQRFHHGGKLIVFGNGAATSDAQHLSVEFAHPVVMGRRALPALTLTADVATVTGVANREGFAEVFAHQLRLLGRPADIALGVSPFGRCVNVLRGLRAGRCVGMLTVGMVGDDGGAISGSAAVDHVLLARSGDPRIIKEVHVTIYHIMWELVHVFLDQQETLATETATRRDPQGDGGR